MFRLFKRVHGVVDLGISMRLKYGFLLKNFTESNTIPVFRTESQCVFPSILPPFHAFHPLPSLLPPLTSLTSLSLHPHPLPYNYVYIAYTHTHTLTRPFLHLPSPSFTSPHLTHTHTLTRRPRT
jgi:hypothetical protein